MMPIVSIVSDEGNGSKWFIMSDMALLAKKEFDSKTLEDSGTRTDAGVLCEVDVPDGQSFYLAYANAWITDFSAASDHAIIELQEDHTGADTQVGEDKGVGITASTSDNAQEQGQLSGADLFSELKGKLIFSNTSGLAKKVKLRVTSVTGAANVRGTIRGWTETNGADPLAFLNL